MLHRETRGSSLCAQKQHDHRHGRVSVPRWPSRRRRRVLQRALHRALQSPTDRWGVVKLRNLRWDSISHQDELLSLHFPCSHFSCEGVRPHSSAHHSDQHHQGAGRSVRRAAASQEDVEDWRKHALYWYPAWQMVSLGTGGIGPNVQETNTLVLKCRKPGLVAETLTLINQLKHDKTHGKKRQGWWPDKNKNKTCFLSTLKIISRNENSWDDNKPVLIDKGTTQTKHIQK